MAAPLAIDLFCGLGGWAEGFLSEGYCVIGFDIERHDYGSGGYPGHLVLQDVTTLCGAQFKNAAVIVASPPCQAYSYRSMPWKRARALPPPDNTLFESCFRIQHEACKAGGRYIPLIVENVRGAQKWVGRARWRFGSYFLWGDVPALMPIVLGTRGQKDFVKLSGNDWNDFRRTGAVSPHWRMQLLAQRSEATKGFGGTWFGNYREARALGRGSPNRYTSSKSLARKAASAEIAKIPFPLAQYIARCFKPLEARV